MGSASSSKSDRTRLTASQSSMETPVSLSMYTRRYQLPASLTYSTSQREQPLASTTGRASWAVKSVILDIITSPRPMGAAIQIEVVQTPDRSPPPEKGAGPVQFIKERAGQAPLYLTYILKSCLL